MDYILQNWIQRTGIKEDRGIKKIGIFIQDHRRILKCLTVPDLVGKEKYKKIDRLRGKGKGEKERYTHPNAEFQRIIWRNKKVFLSEK